MIDFKDLLELQELIDDLDYCKTELEMVSLMVEINYRIHMIEKFLDTN